jgi:hypothetical protein
VSIELTPHGLLATLEDENDHDMGLERE